MTAPEFSKQFSALMQKALESRVPVPQIIHDLTMAKTELGFMYCAAMQHQRANEMAQQMAKDAPKIISPNSN